MLVMVANGVILPCLGYYKVASFHLQGHTFQATLYLLTLGGCDIVFEVDWLRILGPIL